jgi:Flp pilus assembly protein TadD
MTAAQLKLIPELFDRALDQPPAAREAFLKQACAGDEQLYRAVKSLLDSHDATDSFLEVSAMREAAQLLAADAAPSLAAGTQLGRYRILGPLGRGGMGEVYRARDDLAREVAIKILPGHFASDPERAARFEREARTLAQLNHPNIAAIYGREESDGVRFLVLECVPGETLAARLARGPLDVAEAIAAFSQVADALAATHEAGVVHRDFKPANVMLTPQGRVKLLDFGIAKHLGGDAGFSGDARPAFDTSAETLPARAAVTLTRAGATPGTVAYMSPEQCAGQNVASTEAATNADARGVDLWAFGVALYESLAGHHPFRRSTSEETKAAIREREPDWERLPAAVPRRVGRLLRACLEKSPERRLRDAGEAKRALDEAARPSLLTSFREQYRRASRAAKSAAAAGALLVVITAAWGVSRLAQASLLRPSNRPPTRLAVVPWTEGETGQGVQACEPGPSKALARMLEDKLRDVRGLQVVADPETAASGRALPLLMNDLSQSRVAQTQGADNVLRVAAGCAVGDGGRRGFKYSLVSRDGQTLVTGVEGDYRQVLAAALGALSVRAEAAGWPVSDDEQLYYQALVALDQYASEQSVNDAIRILETLRERDAANRTRIIAALGMGWYLKHDLTRKLDDLDKAVAYCDQVSNSDSPDALMRCGVVLMGTAQVERAVANFERALEQRPGDAEATLGLARAYELKGDFDRAEQLYKQAVALRPDYWGGYNELGAFYFERGRYKDAADCWRTVTDLLPLNPYGWSNLGSAELYQAQFGAAQGSFNQSIRQRPS